MRENNNVLFDRDRLIDRGIDEFIGICKGIVFDGVVNYDEAKNLLVWLECNKLVAERWPVSELYSKLSIMIRMKTLTSADEGELLSFLASLAGDSNVMFSERNNPSSKLPLCNPVPIVHFNSANFVITGNLKIGKREYVIELIKSVGGYVGSNNVCSNTHFLIIGDIGSKAWMHSTHGRKIEKAIEFRDKLKSGIHIISESHFMDALNKINVVCGNP